MESLREIKQEIDQLTNKLIDKYTTLGDVSADCAEEYGDIINDYSAEGERAPQEIINKCHCAQDGMEGAREAIKELKSIQANTIVWEDY